MRTIATEFLRTSALRVGKVDLWIGPNKLGTGNITVEKLANASVTFKDLKTPVSFFATITKAHASNIIWYRWWK